MGIKFVSKAAVSENGAFLVWCNCDAALLANANGHESLTCENCGALVTPELVSDSESVSVQDNASGEWKTHHVQGYAGLRSPHEFKVGDLVGHGSKLHRWRIQKIEAGVATVKLLANHKETGMPVEMNCYENVPLTVLRYTPF
jgi:hypothetical protein